jgi:hypothetical protein
MEKPGTDGTFPNNVSRENAGQPDLPYFPTALQNAQMPRRARCVLAFTLLKRALSAWVSNSKIGQIRLSRICQDFMNSSRMSI